MADKEPLPLGPLDHPALKAGQEIDNGVIDHDMADTVVDRSRQRLVRMNTCFSG